MKSFLISLFKFLLLGYIFVGALIFLLFIFTVSLPFIVMEILIDIINYRRKIFYAMF